VKGCIGRIDDKSMREYMAFCDKKQGLLVERKCHHAVDAFNDGVDESQQSVAVMLETQRQRKSSSIGPLQLA
jgi:hypothetical protein